jgi:DNA-binding transcriptional regulator PaaX
MEDKGILVSHRERQKVYYRVADHELMQGCRLLLQARQTSIAQKTKPS